MTFFLAGCGSGPKVTNVTAPGITAPNTAAPITGDPMTAITNDACGSRLQDISGALLEYYALNRDLPVALDDVRNMGDLDAPLKFTCPDTGLPYVYVPRGLHHPGKDMYIIVHDAIPHDGLRHCILMSVSGSTRTPQMQVVVMPETMFLSYH
jgi:hypothetical protein